MTDIRKYYDEDFGQTLRHPEVKLMQARSKMVEDEGKAKAGDLHAFGKSHPTITATFKEHGKSRMYWPQGSDAPMCESEDGTTGVVREGLEDITFGGECKGCPMLDNGCKGSTVLLMDSEEHGTFFINASGRSVTPAIEMVQAAKRRTEADPMIVEIGSKKGGKYNTYAFSFTAI